MKWNNFLTPWILQYLCLIQTITVFVQAGTNSNNKSKHHQRYPPAYFTHTPTNVSRSIGQRAVLQCNVKNLGPRKIIWRKLPGTSPITIGTFTFEPDPNYKVQSNSNREQWDLIIENVQKKHAGTYECQIASSLGLAVTVNLTVLDKPPDNKRHEIHMAGTQYVDVGDTITLQCNATGVDYIPEDVDWFKDGNEIRPNPLTKIYITKYQSVSARSLHSELEIKHGQMSDAGTYICRISEMDIASLKVHVLNDPRKLDKSTGNKKREKEVSDTPSSVHTAVTLSYHSLLLRTAILPLLLTTPCIH